MAVLDILGILPASRLRTISIDESIPLAEQERCPACHAPLTVLSRVMNDTRTVVLRIGVCDVCGYTGFIDRPTLEWIIAFYASGWDKEFPKTLEEVRQGTDLPRTGVKGSRYRALTLHRELGVPKDRPVLEIGTGYGEVLRNLEREGFKTLVGVENSTHRASLVREAFGYPVLGGGFGAHAKAELATHGPYGLIFSHHVFEHMYDPDEIVRTMADLQREGDSLILALPGGEGEHILFSALYLPHIHHFTRQSLDILLNRYGYEIVVDQSLDVSSVVIGARKVANPKPFFPARAGWEALMRARLERALRIDQMPAGEVCELYWEQAFNDPDRSSLTVIGPQSMRIDWSWKIRSLVAYVKSRYLRRFKPGYRYRVRRAPEEADPLEFHFRGPIRLMLR